MKAVCEGKDYRTRLKDAKAHIFSTGLTDIGTALCRANMPYGIAKIHYAQEVSGETPDCLFISGPDETVTRNEKRWESGFGYGGKLVWGDGNTKLVVLDVMPNACGMLVGGLDALPHPKELVERIESLETSDTWIDDLKVQWDFSKSNHFIDVFKTVRLSDVDLPEYAFIVHSGAPEVRGDNPKGFGLYVNKSRLLREMAKPIDTPFGRAHVLRDNDATAYLDFFRFAATFSKKKRAHAAETLFGNYNFICDHLHQGLINYNEMLLGTHHIADADKNIFPIALRADLPAYLIRGKCNLTDEIIEVLGFAKRAERLGVYDKLKHANILPHGAGYTFRDLLTVTDVIEKGNDRYFVTDMHNAVGQKIISNPKDLEFSYRGRDVIVRVLELELGEVVARLMPEYVLKV